MGQREDRGLPILGGLLWGTLGVKKRGEQDCGGATHAWPETVAAEEFGMISS
jgi:hypothetical protein